MIVRFILLVWLIPCAILDFKNREIPLLLLLLGLAGCVLMAFVFQDMSLIDGILGLLVGGILLLAAKISKGSIGMADGMVVCGVGAVIGFIDIMLITCLSFLIAFPIGLADGWIREKRCSLQHAIPWIPCFLLVYGGTLIICLVMEYL